MYHYTFHPVHSDVVSKNKKWALAGHARGVAVVKANKLNSSDFPRQYSSTCISYFSWIRNKENS